MEKTAASGACLCGSITFTMQFPSKWVAHCHCSRCQRAHGAAFVTWVGVDAAQVAITDEHNKLRWHISSAGGERGFCCECGSSLFFRSGDWPGELHIARALFADPIDREPRMHGYYDTHVPWVSVVDELPRKPDPASQA